MLQVRRQIQQQLPTPSSPSAQQPNQAMQNVKQNKTWNKTKQNKATDVLTAALCIQEDSMARKEMLG